MSLASGLSICRVSFGDQIEFEFVRPANELKDAEVLWRSLGISTTPAEMPPVPMANDLAELHRRNGETIRRLMRRTLSCN